MTTLLAYITGLGLATGAGGKACIPVLALGLFHFTPWFELSGRFAWIASPPVLVVVGVIAIAEIVVDAHPELGRYADAAGYLPKAAAGFIALAAATGRLDESLVRLGASGVLGAATAVGATWLRNRARSALRDSAEHVHEKVGKALSYGEAGTSAVMSTLAILLPLLVLVIMALNTLAAVGIAKGRKARRVPCGGCGRPVHPEAVVCPHCREETRKGEVTPPHERR